MRFRPKRFAKARWRAVERAYRRHVVAHRRAALVALLVFGAGVVLLATFSSRHSEQLPAPSLARPDAAVANI